MAWFAAMAIAEVYLSRGVAAGAANDGRLITNFGLTALSLLAGSLVPVASVTAALADESYSIGLAQNISMPWIAILLLALLGQSFAYYWVHRLMHRVPLMWRLHRIHHADSAVDVSTSLRNHPLELLITVPVTVLVFLALGAPVSVVVAANTIFVAAAILHHADIVLPDRLERALARVIVTPRLHRVHHSTERCQHDRNYGNLVIFWDRLFRTLDSSDTDRVGLDHQPARADSLLDQICSPFMPLSGDRAPSPASPRR